ncbi:hypothetical protein ACX80U_09790 [Arthrobacter sp. TmT3-37]
MTNQEQGSPNGHRRRRAQLLLFIGMPIVAGLLTLLTGTLQPVFAAMLIYLLPLISPSTRDGALANVAPVAMSAPRESSASWWARRRRWGFYAAFSVLLALSLAFLRSALTDTWGGGDAALAVLCLIPIVVIFRKPPQIVAGFGRSRSVASPGNT